MRICVLLSDYQRTTSAFRELDPGVDPRPWLESHEADLVIIGKETAGAQIEALAETGYKVFVNLCDGTPDDDLAGVEVIEALERLGLAFTGPTSRLYRLTKDEMKQTALEAAVATPAFAFAQTEADIDRAVRSLYFPMIVKHYNGYASVGMTPASRVTDARALESEARRMIALAGGALIEEFIEGGEATVLLAENPDDPARPLVLKPVLCAFPAGASFKHFELKWLEYAGLQWFPCEDPMLERRLVEAASRIFTAIGGVSFSRCDFRLDEEGRVWFLEVNTACGIFFPPGQEGSADMILNYDPMGHRGFLEHILRCALRRRLAA